MNEFDYYKYGTRLIRVNELKNHFKDITPDKTTHLDAQHLKERFPTGFQFITTLDLNTDNDEFMILYNSFKTTIRNFAKSNGCRLDDDQKELIYKHLEAGTPFRQIAKSVGVNVSTVSRMAKKQVEVMG